MNIDSIGALRKALRERIPAVCWIASDEPLLEFEASDLYRARARAQGYTERTVIETGAGFDGSMLVGQAQARSLFGERRVLDVRLANRLTRDFGESLARAADGLDEDTRILVSGARIDKGQQKAAWLAHLRDRLVVVDLPRIDARAFADWVVSQLREHRLTAAPDAIALLVDRTEGNPVAAAQAVRRLALVHDTADQAIDVATMDEVVQDSAHYESFGLVDAALAGQGAQALRIVDNLRASDAPLPLLAWALADALRRLIRIQQARAQGEPVQQALRSGGAFGARADLYRHALNRVPARRAWQLLRETAWLDKAAKGVAGGAGLSIGAAAGLGQGETSAAGGLDAGLDDGPVDVWAGVERIILGLSGQPRLAE